ncbi:MAG: fluoride efflux transporter CrcB [Bacteroidetes bacterium]|nr:fluoride efflux transporter CrcB [Bacteroidota bacterium]
MSKVAYILAGGALGALLRYGVTMFSFRESGGSFPWSTLIVNILGSFVAGFVWGYLNQSTDTERLHAFLMIGVLGAFTTFSAYSLESVQLFDSGSVNLAVANVLSNNVGAILFAFAGIGLAKWVFPQAV